MSPSMTDTKEVIEFDAALTAKPVEEAAKPRKRWSFIKTQCPAQKIRLSGDRVIAFRLIHQRRGGFAAYSEFSTDDETLANELREVHRGGKHYIFEKE